MKLETIYADYLKEAGALGGVKMGAPQPKITVTAKGKELLLSNLIRESKFNNRLVLSITVLHFLLFILAICMVYYYRDSPTTVGMILGGSVLSLLAIARSLKELWRKKWEIDILVTILPELSPEEALKAIKGIYYSKVMPNDSQERHAVRAS